MATEEDAKKELSKAEEPIPPLEQLVVRIELPEYAAGSEVQDFKSAEYLQKWFAEKSQANEHYYEEDRMIMAWRGVTALIHVLTQLKETAADAEVQRASAKLLEEYTASPFVTKVHEIAEQSRQLLYAFQNQAGWTLAHDADNIQTYSRAEKDTSLSSFKVVGEIKAPLLKVAVCLNEVDLYSNWFPMLKTAKELKAVSRFRKVVHMEESIPWPVWNRDCVANCFAVDMLEETKLLINVRSIDKFDGLEIPPPASGVVRSEIRLGGFLITPLSHDASRFEMLMNVDPKIDFMPHWLLNWFVKQVIHFVVFRLRTAANFTPKDEYQRRLEAKPEFYEYIRRKIDEHFPPPAAAAPAPAAKR